ncbi:MAG: transcriptional repressor LexA [Planctomycetes bacterium]|nr:transcriptional repressor LexA [Planctomycetota bacterium]
MNITPKQLRILKFIQTFTESNHYSPTLQEIADEIGVSKITILDHLRALERRGIIRRQRYLSRSIEVVVGLSETEPGGVVRSKTSLPLMGRITAGAPLEAAEHQEVMDIADLMVGRKDCFVLEVRGSSMIEDHIKDGDYVVVEKRDRANDGETVVALLANGETTLKRFYRQGSKFRLQPANSTMPPILVDQVTIQGVVTGVFRRY